MRDDEEEAVERAEPGDVGVGTEGEQVTGQVEPPSDATVVKTQSGGHEDKVKSHSYDGVLGTTANDLRKVPKPKPRTNYGKTSRSCAYKTT